MGNSISLEEELINLRMVSKQMQRSSKKCEKNEKAAVDKLKKVRSCVQMSRCIMRRGESLRYAKVLQCAVNCNSSIMIVNSFYRPSNRGIRRGHVFMHKMQYEKRIR